MTYTAEEYAKMEAEIERLKKEAYDEAHGVQLETGLTIAELVEDWRKGKAEVAELIEAHKTMFIEAHNARNTEIDELKKEVAREIDNRNDIAWSMGEMEKSLRAEIERIRKKHNDLLETMAPAGPELTLEEADEEVDKVGDHMRAVLSSSPRSPDVVHWGCRC